MHEINVVGFLINMLTILLSAKIFGELAQIVLGAAVIDDILGIIILSAVQGIAVSGKFSWASA